MQSFFDWYNSGAPSDKPWLILGKGPTFEKHIKYDLNAFNVMTLNHAIDKLKADFAHMIDLDVVDRCQQAIDKNASYLVMPWVPHQDNKPGNQDLADLIKTKPILAKLSSENRLLFYNHLPGRRQGDSPLIRVRYFSSEAAINLLATSGVPVIRMLGVDGGSSYSQTFSDLQDVTLLANGRKTFNKQFTEIARTIMDTGVDLAPLDLQSPIKVYVATTEAQMLAVKVLEYSIRKHASMSVEVVPLHTNKIDIPQPSAIENWPRTPFSFQRFLIPQLQDFKGHAIYLDSDMQVFKDIKDMWTHAFNDAQILTVRNADESNRRPQFSVMLLDCERLGWDIKEIVAKLDDASLSYEKLMHEMAVAKKITAAIGPEWNSLEHYEDEITALLHYTDMNTQPWVSQENPLGYLWFRDLFEAVDAGFIPLEYIRQHVELGYVRPSLLYQVEHRIEDSFLLPGSAKSLDDGYKPPYQGMASYKSSKLRNVVLTTKAHLRNILKSIGWFKYKKKLTGFLDRG